MANKKSAEKRMRQDVGRRARNRAHRSAMRTAIKRLRTAVAEGRADDARQLLTQTVSLVNAKAQKGIIHRNAAARTTSRLTRAVSALS